MRPKRGNSAGRNGRPDRFGRPDARPGERGEARGARSAASSKHGGVARVTENDSADLCWGRNPVLTLLEENASRCLKVVVSKTMQRGMFEKITELCKASGIPYSLAEPRAMDGMLPGENHQGIIATLAASRMYTLEEAMALLPPPPEPALAVLLDHIQDPHNLGAIIRSAEAAGAVFVALPLRRSSLPTGTVIKTSAGASLRLPIAAVGNVAVAVRELQEANLWTIGLDAKAGKSIYDEPLPARALLVVGGEGKGLARTTEQVCDECLNIPIKGGAGSLNASIALSLGMFEWARMNGNS